MAPDFPGASAIAQVCLRHAIASLRIFGSAIWSDFGPDSDIDMLVEFRPGFELDLFELGGLQQNLTDLFGREVDLKTPEMFSETSLQRVVGSSRVAYAA